MSVKVQSQHAWTESTIVLNWLSSDPSVWATFVANRLSKIQENKPLFWNNVQTHGNPADPASREVDPSKLENLDATQAPIWRVRIHLKLTSKTKTGNRTSNYKN